MRGVGYESRRGMAGVAWPVWCGAVAAFVGGVLILVGIFWVVFSTGMTWVSGSGVLSVPLRLAGPVGVALSTGSLFGLYALLLTSRSLGGVLWGSLGALVVGLGIVALAWIVTHQPPLVSAEVGNTGPFPFLGISALLVAWIRPLGILMFGIAAMLADLRGPWEYVLFAIGILETPLPALALLYLTGPTITAGWQVLVLGVPGVQTGLVGALAWFVLASALYVSWRELNRRSRRR